MKVEQTRRAFIAGSAASALLVAGGAEVALASEPQVSADEVLSADVVIVGAGLSGLSAAVEAVDSGLSVIVLEKTEAAGGNGKGVEGIFGVNSKLQLEQGIDVDPGAVFRHEMEFAQNRPDGVAWRDLISKSADNIDWLCDHGVTLSGLVNDYGGLFATMHWFEGGVASVGYIPAMLQAAEDGGAQVLLETAATSLITEDGSVKGVLAEAVDGSIIKVEASAVVIATGGFGEDEEMVARAGWPLEHSAYIGFPGHTGDGIKMCIEAGAADKVEDACFLCGTSIVGLAAQGTTGTALCFGGPFIWVTPEGERCINEDFAASNMMNIAIPLQVQREIWCVANQEVIDVALATSENASASDTGLDPADEIASAVEAGNILKADSVEELAVAAGMDPEVLAATVERYNELCAEGHDWDCGKDAAYMLPIDSAPYYLYRLDPNIMVAMGGVDTNRNMQVLNDDHEPIPGLYAVGVDGVRLYRNVYPINCGASCCGNNINSGRTAIQHIAANLVA